MTLTMPFAIGFLILAIIISFAAAALIVSLLDMFNVGSDDDEEDI